MRALTVISLLLVFGMSTLSAKSVALVATPATVSVATAPARPKTEKVSYLQRVKTFFKTLAQELLAPPSKGLLIVLAFLIPWLAVGLATDWELKHVLINILLGMFTCIGGIIHAIIIVNKYAK